ncbi:hypothetical protein MKZ38_004889 [Zalerion maritima]|uniref:Uncharacterized protein n=1 Tax=Zalerion maritima TaxID=339359 RepID=A0AAD5RYC2_9PEZI|nr:hypothetical protein MKZ38_004889 [Zalerion maritima]
MDSDAQLFDPLLQRSFVAQSVEIDSANYLYILPPILDVISKAAFVAIDLEMSGITVGNGDSMPTSSMTTTDESYEKAKKTAQTYCILQVGITAIKGDSGDSFDCQTYHLKLNPMTQKDSKRSAASYHLSARTNRVVAFSTTAMEFLGDHGFDIISAFSDGVPYLSRPEREAYQPYISGNGTAFTDIDCLDDPEVKEFCQSVRATVHNWLDKGIGTRRYVNISLGPKIDLSRLQAKLVHHTVQTEFPQCTTRAMGGFVQVTMKDHLHEAKTMENTKKMRREVVSKNIGAALLFEALSGGDFASYFPDMWNTMGLSTRTASKVKLVVDESQARLKERKPIIIAHNSLYDLCFIHQTFFGPLPESLKDFTHAIHKLFPRVIDTKYMFLKESNLMVEETSLETCYRKSKYERFPKLAWLTSNCFITTNLKSTKAHDAGYDSYMTAVVAMKQGFKLTIDANPKLPNPNKAVLVPPRTHVSCQLASDTGTAEGREEGFTREETSEADLPPRAKDPFWESSPFKSKEITEYCSMEAQDRDAAPHTMVGAPIGTQARTGWSSMNACRPKQQNSIRSTAQEASMFSQGAHQALGSALMGPRLNPAADQFQPTKGHTATSVFIPGLNIMNYPEPAQSRFHSHPPPAARMSGNFPFSLTNHHNHGNGPRADVPDFVPAGFMGPRSIFQRPGPRRPVKITRPPEAAKSDKAGSVKTKDAPVKIEDIKVDSQDEGYMPLWGMYLFAEYGNRIPVGRRGFLIHLED